MQAQCSGSGRRSENRPERPSFVRGLPWSNARNGTNFRVATSERPSRACLVSRLTFLVLTFLFLFRYASSILYRLRIMFDNKTSFKLRHKMTYASQSHSHHLSSSLLLSFYASESGVLSQRSRTTSNRHELLPRGSRTLILLPRLSVSFVRLHLFYSISFTDTPEVALLYKTKTQPTSNICI